MWKQVARMLLVTVLCLVPAGAIADAAVSVKVAGKAYELERPGLLQNGRLFVTDRDFAGMINATVKTEANQVTFSAGKRTITLMVDRAAAVVDGETRTVERGAVKRDGRVFVPIRWCAEQFGFTVGWEASTRTATLDPPASKGSFQRVAEDSLTEEELDFIARVKNEQGIHQLGNLYVVARGPVPNPGYGIRVVKQEMSFEQLRVFVELTDPEPGRMYPQVISYPYLVGRADVPPYTTVVFLDAKTGKPLF